MMGVLHNEPLSFLKWHEQLFRTQRLVTGGTLLIKSEDVFCGQGRFYCTASIRVPMILAQSCGRGGDDVLFDRALLISHLCPYPCISLDCKILKPKR